jgi:hypothetical protein
VILSTDYDGILCANETVDNKMDRARTSMRINKVERRRKKEK